LNCGQYDQHIPVSWHCSRGWKIWWRSDSGQDWDWYGSWLPSSRSPENRRLIWSAAGSIEPIQLSVSALEESHWRLTS
jgi:hypothetical protein